MDISKTIPHLLFTPIMAGMNTGTAKHQDRYERDVLARGWPLLARGFAMLLALLNITAIGALDRLPEHLRARVLARLRPLEIYARRLLVIEALRGAIPNQLIKRVKQGERSVSSKVSGVGAPRSRFCLLEPHPSTTPYHLRRPICRPRPRIRSFDEPVATAPAPQKPDAALRRLAAFEALLAAPQKAAARLARWFARRRQGVRRSPLRLSRLRLPPDHELRPYIEYAGFVASEAMDRLPRPPDPAQEED